VEWSIGNEHAWIAQVAQEDPARAVDLVAKLAEYTLPKPRTAVARAVTSTSHGVRRLLADAT
jgi:hypothetical protein